MLTRAAVFPILWIWSYSIQTSTNVVSANETVTIDLRSGVVTGYSSRVSFVVPPSGLVSAEPPLGRCSRRAVLRLDLSGALDKATFLLDYDVPRLWTLHVARSPSADGHGAPAELLLFNRQLTAHAPPLRRLVDSVLNRGRTRFTVTLADAQVQWAPAKGRMESLSLPRPTTQRHLVFVGLNRVVGGEWRSGSGLCRAQIVMSRDQDECALGTHDCDRQNAVCSDTRKAFRCTCSKGYEGDGRKCTDKDECKSRNGGCVHLCNNLPGNYTCSCLAGFKLDVDGKNCLDVNECSDDRGGCQHLCLNTIGSYECKCRDGYTVALDGRSCTAVLPSCRTQGCQHGCDSDGACVCRAGFLLAKDGRSCRPTCSVGNGWCQHRCTTTADGPICICHNKYILGIDQRSCSPSCAVGNGGCERRCHNTDIGVRCSCPNGLLLDVDGKSCLDVDECATNNGGCSYQCHNNFGSFECICPEGYKLKPEETTCTDVDECSVNGTCDHICINTDGSYHCQCRPGYLSFGITHCGDVDECRIDNGGCEQLCANTEGAFECGCQPGFHLHPNKRDCLPNGHCQLPTTSSATSGALLLCGWRGATEQCHLKCLLTGGSQLSVSNDSFSYSCGPLQPMSASRVADDRRRHLHLVFTASQCQLRDVTPVMEEQPLLIDIRQPWSSNSCRVLEPVHRVRVQCAPYRQLKHQLQAAMPVRDDQRVLLVQLELMSVNQGATGSCGDFPCDSPPMPSSQFQYVDSILRKIVDKGVLHLSDVTRRHYVRRRSIEEDGISGSQQNACTSGYLAVGDKCVLCHEGSYYEVEAARCLPCPEGTYQAEGGQLSCDSCPLQTPHPKGILGAKHVDECGRPCVAGFFSQDGFEPCVRCSSGTYQPFSGRTGCFGCQGGMTRSHRTALTSFKECLTPVCPIGHHWSVETYQCSECPVGTYQNQTGQNYCAPCPIGSSTDTSGANSVSECKGTKCGGFLGPLLGVIESPNYPGDYPSNAQCTWKISPGRGRRILVVVPEIFLADDKCDDYLVMRKSHSPYSVTSYQSCKTQERPLAFSARSKKLWIRFKSNGKRSGKGFRIPYVLYNAEYRPLIEDIVRDTRLYATTTHQQILKDWKLLGALMDVIAHPINYYKYANSSRLMFPNSFIRLMTPKVRKFFSYR